MARYSRRLDLVTNTFAYKVFGKRMCDLNKDELKKYNRLKQNESRNRRRANRG